MVSAVRHTYRRRRPYGTIAVLALLAVGLVALPGVSENPDIQIVMIHQWQPAERNER